MDIAINIFALTKQKSFQALWFCYGFNLVENFHILPLITWIYRGKIDN